MNGVVKSAFKMLTKQAELMDMKLKKNAGIPKQIANVSTLNEGTLKKGLNNKYKFLKSKKFSSPAIF